MIDILQAKFVYYDSLKCITQALMKSIQPFSVTNLVSNMLQSFTWINHDRVQWHLYSSQGLGYLNRSKLRMVSLICTYIWFVPIQSSMREGNGTSSMNWKSDRHIDGLVQDCIIYSSQGLGYLTRSKHRILSLICTYIWFDPILSPTRVGNGTSSVN